MTPATNLKLRTWLANGLETAVPDFIKGSAKVAGAIYHLTDGLWIIPAMQAASAGKLDIVYDSHIVAPDKPSPNQTAVDLPTNAAFHPRDETKIMHDKFLVGNPGTADAKLLTGSANFTTEGLTSQANVLHTFDAPQLAEAYAGRQAFLAPNPTMAETQAQAKWNGPYAIGAAEAQVRVFFPPESGKGPSKGRLSMGPVVNAVKNAASSVMFCLYDPTDLELIQACFAAGDADKVLFGLVNSIKKPVDDPHTPAQLGAVEVYTRSTEKKDVVRAGAWDKTTPMGFLQERKLYPGERPPAPKGPPVIIHHKFIIVDAETAKPIIYTGSANMSDASQHGNDENLLEITGATSLAAVYMSEFLRLYEHYRARATLDTDQTLKLKSTSEWANAAFKSGTPECKARVAFVK